MAPATESIMGSLPPAKAGVGSAMNDTTRQMGGALGVAVLGSVFALVYRPGMSDATAGLGLTAEQASRAQDSIGGAMQVATELPTATAAQLVDVAKHQFVDGMHSAIRVAIVVVLIAAFVVFKFLPARAHDYEAPVEVNPADAADGYGSGRGAPALEPAVDVVT